MSQGPPVEASSLPPAPASASITRLAPETLTEILAFAVYKEWYDGELEVYLEVVSAKTLKRITLVSKLWRDCAKPLHFQTLRFTYTLYKPCKALRPFQLNPSLANHVHSLRLSISLAGSKFYTTENYRPLMDWMGSLKNLTHLRLDAGEIPRDSYAAWPLDAFPRVEALYLHTEADSFFNHALISRMPNLEALFLATGGYRSNPETAAQHLVAVNALPNSRCLTQLFFFKGDITSSAFRHLVQTSGVTLEVLEVYKAYTIDDEDLAFAIDVAPNLKRLQWCNEKYQMGAIHDTITPHPPTLLRALSTSHITDLNIRPWPTLDVLDAFPDTLVKLELGSVLTYPGRRPNWSISREPDSDYTLGQEAKELQNDTYKAILDARVAGRFSKLDKCFDMMGHLVEMDDGLKDRAAREGLKWYGGKEPTSS